MEEVRTYRIPEENLEPLKAKLATANKRRKKLGSSLVEVVVVDTEVVTLYHVPHGTLDRVPSGEVDVFYHIQLTGAGVAKINGWRLLGTIETTEAGNILRAVPGEVIPESYRIAKARCQHCNAARYRKNVFVVGDDNGETLLVGRQCLRDFLGHANPEFWADYAEYAHFVDDLMGEFMGRGERVGRKIDPEAYLAWVAGAVREYGWIGRAKAREHNERAYNVTEGAVVIEDGEQVHEASFKTASADTAYTHMFPPTTRFERRYWYNKEDEAKASAALAWAKELKNRPGLTDFLANVAVVSQLRFWVEKQIGIAAAIIIAYDKETGILDEQRRQREAQKEAAAREAAVSEYQGEIGKRCSLELTVEKAILVSTNDYTFRIYKMVDAQGNVYTWKTSTVAGEYVVRPGEGEPWTRTDWVTVKEGSCYKLKGTVKQHKEYKGVKQTELQRCKFELGAE